MPRWSMAAQPLVIRLLGRPTLELPDGTVPYRMRSRKSWALLAYLLLSGAAPSRSQLAGLLFAEADDPLRALRWSLAEVRRALGGYAEVDGDPVVLHRSADVVVDVQLLDREWASAVETPRLGAELLEGLSLRAAPGFESWLLSERRRAAAASEAVLHEAALGLMARGELDRARGPAVRAAALAPLDENHQALLIRLYRLAGDHAAAARQYASWVEVLDEELGVAPGAAVEAAMRERPREQAVHPSTVAVWAALESGAATIAAGAVEPGVVALRTGVELADATGDTALRTRSRQVLAEALIHSLRGLDEEGVALLHEADRLAVADGDVPASAQARAELGYVDFLRARYDRAERWLTESLDLAAGSAPVQAKAATYLGSVHSDTGDYRRAGVLLDRAVRLARDAGDARRDAYALCMTGRLALLLGRVDEADAQLAAAVALAEREHWLAFLPWPQAFQGEVLLARGESGRAAEVLEQAFARACHLGDPCWEGISARGLALVAAAKGDVDRAFETLQDARTRSARLADPYVWLDAHILDAMCDLGRRHAHPSTAAWADTLRDLASRTRMRELTVRALLHRAALGEPGDAEAAAALAQEVDNPVLHDLVRRSAA